MVQDGRTSQLEDALAKTESDADALLRASSMLTRAAKRLRSVAQVGNLRDMQPAIAATYVFHFDRWWNPAVEHQAEDRSHRLGQTVPVNVYKYTCEGTIEDRIDEILRGKQLLFDEIIDDVSMDLRSVLTREELFGLFGLTPPAARSLSI